MRMAFLVLHLSSKCFLLRQQLHDQWVEAEKLAQEEFHRKKSEEERRKNERLEQEVSSLFAFTMVW